MKLVSTMTWYGGPSWLLYLKKRAVDVFSLQQQHFINKLGHSNGVGWNQCGEKLTFVNLHMPYSAFLFAVVLWLFLQPARPKMEV